MRDDLLDNPTHHKEASKARMHSDSSDRQKLQAKLSQCIKPLSPVGHSTTVFNIFSGKLAVNVHNALQLGKECRQGYDNKLLSVFYVTIGSPLVTMATNRKKSKLGQT